MFLQHHSFMTVWRACKERHFHFMRQKSWWALTWGGGPPMSPLVLDTICLGCLTWGRSPRSPQRECLGQDWQTLRILQCPLGGCSQNHSPTPVRWSPRRLRSARCSFACRLASGLRARCPPLFETSPTLEARDWFLQCRDMSFDSDRRAVTDVKQQKVHGGSHKPHVLHKCAALKRTQEKTENKWQM